MIISGGVVAPQGFSANGIHCGIRKNKTKKDLALIVSSVKCNAGCVYTQNKVKGAPLIVTKENLKDGKAQAIICNSGNANTCNADGIEIATKMCEGVGSVLNISPKDIIVASTGVIGQPLDVMPILNSLDTLKAGLGDNSKSAVEAIMTTDTTFKEVAVEFFIGDKKCKIGGIAKGSGMIHPNMATMLVFVTTDVAISSEMLKEAISEDVADSFNMVSVDGDTSTNDMYCIMANGLAKNKEIIKKDNDYFTFKENLKIVSQTLCKMIASDGEGATKLIECNVYGEIDTKNAKLIAKAIIGSSLLKAAMFGADANWGRVLCAIGYSGAQIDVGMVDVNFSSKKGKIDVCKNGAGLPFDEEIAKEILLEKEIQLNVTIGEGSLKATAWGCDLTYDYVKINGDYRT